MHILHQSTFFYGATFRIRRGPMPADISYTHRESERTGVGADLEEIADDFSVIARYDVGEASNFILTPMLVAALEQLTEWGVENVGRYCGQLTGDLLADLAAAGFGVTDEGWRCGHLFGFRVPEGFDVPAFRERLASQRVSVALRGDAIRVAPYLYNDESDVAALRCALQL